MNQALKKSYRTQLTKLVNQANEMLSAEIFNVKEAVVLISRIKTVNETLNKLNKELAHDVPADQIDSECEKIMEYEDKAVSAIAGLEFETARVGYSDINTKGVDGKVQLKATDGESAQGCPQAMVEHNKRSVRLPKLELVKFNGDYRLWPAFWEQFNTTIHTNNVLDDSSKFTYLKSVITGNVAVTIQGLTYSGSSYIDAVELLKEQYGNKEKIVDSYIQQLLALTQVKNKTDITSWRQLYNSVSKITKSLQTLGMSPENYGMMVKSIVLKALPFSLKAEFHKRQVTSSNCDNNESVTGNINDSNVPASRKDISYERQICQLLNFIKLEIDSIEQAKVLEGMPKNKDRHFQGKNEYTCTAAGLFASVKEQCLFCKLDHNTVNCKSQISLPQKNKILKLNKRSYRCTRPNHNSKYCRVKISCSQCKAKHATTMCDPNYRKSQNVTSVVSPSNSGPAVEGPPTNLLANGRLNNVYLQTACAKIMTSDGSTNGIVRFILDGGSQLTFIKECLSRQLNLPVIGNHKISIMTFGKLESAPARLCRKVSVTLKSNYSEDLVIFNAVEVPEICFDSLCTPSLEDPAIHEFSINFPLADFYAYSDKVLPGISLLVGADSYWKIVNPNTHKITDNLMGIETKFGWTVHGTGSASYNDYAFPVGANIANILYVHSESVVGDLDLKNFWTLEAIGINNSNVNERLQTNNFLKNNVVLENNRYCVSLPWTDNNVRLDSNFNGAFSRLKYLIRKLVASGKLEEYDKVIREYMDNDCAELSPDITNADRTYFMPHRAVYRDDKDTSKIRVVFDASTHAPGLPSLNDLLLQGENLVPHLVRILINFRVGKIALITDIEKAFLQIELSERDRDSHSFLWYEATIKDSSNLPNIVKFRMKRVTFGVNCSPFLLAVILKSLFQSQFNEFKTTSEILASSFCVDDLVLAVNNVKEAEQIYYESKLILSKASMNLRKWGSNDFTLRQIMSVKNTTNVKKVLGVLWYINDDDLSIDLNPVFDAIPSSPVTKRGFLQTVSKVFDPLGFLSPFLIRAKILLQEIWKAKLDWDSLLPQDLANGVIKWYSELETLKGYALNRCVMQNNNFDVSLHLFSDASPLAYGAVAYLRVVDSNNQIECNLLMAKNRVAPINEKAEKSLTLPKLELTAAVCAVRLQHFILENIKIRVDNCTLWTDSKITLHWIRGKAARWKPYVCNRVMEIQKLSVGTWRHCSGADNPADLLTRGIKSSKLVESDIWKNGPKWLKGPYKNWPEDELSTESLSGLTSVFMVQEIELGISEPIFPLDKFSSLEKTFRITGYINRFCHNIKNRDNRKLGILCSEEVKNSEKYWIKLTQTQYFRSELSALRNEKELQSTSSILTLNPFLDNESILRLGGRLHKSTLPFRTKHPVILPKKSILTDKIIWNAHMSMSHGGVNTTIAQVRKRFWIIQCRQRVKSILNKCLTCRKLRAQPCSEPFAPLPKDRVTIAAPFKVTGTDFAGPLYIVTEHKEKQKVYIMLFTCAVISAIHMEIVTSLNVESSINSLRRFISKRGVPEIIYSDNAKTFKRVALELQELTKMIRNEKFQNFASNPRIEWKFIVDHAPWWGGFWERMIRTVKDSLKLTIGRKLLNYDELLTVISEVEAAVNSRPLTYVDEDPDNLLILSPSHFLLDFNDSQFPLEDSYSGIKRIDILQKWKERNYFRKLFWKKWSCDYLQQLRLFHFQKHVKSNDFKVADVAILKDPNVPRLMWKLVRINRIFQGRDGRARACEVITNNKIILRRPIQALYPLEITAAGEDVEKSKCNDMSM